SVGSAAQPAAVAPMARARMKLKFLSGFIFFFLRRGLLVRPLCSADAILRADRNRERTGTWRARCARRQLGWPGQPSFVVSRGLAARRVMQPIVVTVELVRAEMTNATAGPLRSRRRPASVLGGSGQPAITSRTTVPCSAP